MSHMKATNVGGGPSPSIKGVRATTAAESSRKGSRSPRNSSINTNGGGGGGLTSADRQHSSSSSSPEGSLANNNNNINNATSSFSSTVTQGERVVARDHIGVLGTHVHITEENPSPAVRIYRSYRTHAPAYHNSAIGGGGSSSPKAAAASSTSQEGEEATGQQNGNDSDCSSSNSCSTPFLSPKGITRLFSMFDVVLVALCLLLQIPAVGGVGGGAGGSSVGTVVVAASSSSSFFHPTSYLLGRGGGGGSSTNNCAKQKSDIMYATTTTSHPTNTDSSSSSEMDLNLATTVTFGGHGWIPELRTFLAITFPLFICRSIETFSSEMIRLVAWLMEIASGVDGATAWFTQTEFFSKVRFGGGFYHAKACCPPPSPPSSSSSSQPTVVVLLCPEASWLAPTFAQPSVFWPLVFISFILIKIPSRMQRIAVEEVMVIRGVGIQLTTRNFMDRVVKQEFIDLSVIRALVIHEAYFRHRVIFVLGVLIDGSDEFTVLYEESLPRLAPLRRILIGLRGTLYDEEVAGLSLADISAVNATAAALASSPTQQQHPPSVTPATVITAAPGMKR